MPVLASRCDVVLLAAVRAVAVPNQPELFEGIQGAVDGGRNRLRLSRAAQLHQLGPGDVTPGAGQNLDDVLALGGPAQPPPSQPFGCVGPGAW